MSTFSKYYCIPVVVVGMLFFTLIVSGCSRKQSSPVIARVGSSVLTIDDLYESIPPEYSNRISKEQHINYVKQWIDIELLYQEALRRKIDKEPVIKDRLQRMKKDLLSAEIISRNTLKVQAKGITDDAVSNYFTEHASEFVREKDMVKFLEIVVESSQEASEVKRMATADNFEALVSRYSNDASAINVPYVAVDEIDPRISQVIAATPHSGIKGPIKTDHGYHVLQVIDVLDAGGMCKEEEVKEEIVNILSAQLQKKEFEKTLSDLRMKNDVTVNFDSIPGKIKTTPKPE